MICSGIGKSDGIWLKSNLPIGSNNCSNFWLLSPRVHCPPWNASARKLCSSNANKGCNILMDIVLGGDDDVNVAWSTFCFLDGLVILLVRFGCCGHNIVTAIFNSVIISSVTVSRHGRKMIRNSLPSREDSAQNPYRRCAFVFGSVISPHHLRKDR